MSAQETVVFMQTDKSGRPAVSDVESYLRMGDPHISKDLEIDMEEVVKRADLLDSHASMYIKMFNIGQAHNHGWRMRESFLGSDCPAPLYLLIKDHKGRNSDGTFKTRPVVSGNLSYNAGFSETLSEILESVFKERGGSNLGVISTDDLLRRVEDVNMRLRMSRRAADEGGTGGTPGTGPGEGRPLTMVGTDVEALFPSLEKAESARICMEMVVKSLKM